MRIFITSIGSRGDIQPYVALGRGLSARGHDVTFCTSERFAAFVAGHGLPFAPVSDDLVALIDSVEGRGVLEDMGGFLTGARTFINLVKRTAPIRRALFQETWTAARDAAPDLIVYSAKMSGAPHYADKLRIPAVMAVPFPQLVPTAAYPTIGFPRAKLGGWYNRATYRVILALAGQIGRKDIQEWRSANNLPPRSATSDILHRNDGSAIPILHAFSRHVVPVPPDWPDSAPTTGYWFLDRPADWKPPAALEQFLASGEPPVYIGFGSMAGRNPRRATAVVIKALQRTGLRGVLGAGWGGLTPDALPETMTLVHDVPHDWLFSRVAAVVHHGGAGTTAAGLRAGCPTVICPFFGDQPFWGRRVHDLGVGSVPIPQKRLTADRLAAAIREVTTNPVMRKNAAALGEKIRGESGVATAIDFLERISAP